MYSFKNVQSVQCNNIVGFNMKKILKHYIAVLRTHGNFKRMCTKHVMEGMLLI